MSSICLFSLSCLTYTSKEPLAYYSPSDISISTAIGLGRNDASVAFRLWKSMYPATLPPLPHIATIYCIDLQKSVYHKLISSSDRTLLHVPIIIQLTPEQLSVTMTAINCDVLVVGGGNAGFSAALSAAQSHAGKIILIDKCPEDWAGGNSHFTAGAFRTAHGGLSDLLPIITNVDAEMAKIIDLDPYTTDDFLDDMERVTHGRYDKELGKTLVGESNDVVKWLANTGLGFQLGFNRQVSFMAEST